MTDDDEALRNTLKNVWPQACYSFVCGIFFSQFIVGFVMGIMELAEITGKKC